MASGGITLDINKSEKSIRQLISSSLFLYFPRVSVGTNLSFVVYVLLLLAGAGAVG